MSIPLAIDVRFSTAQFSQTREQPLRIVCLRYHQQCRIVSLDSDPFGQTEE
jgi:hypothetical protein